MFFCTPPTPSAGAMRQEFRDCSAKLRTNY